MSKSGKGYTCYDPYTKYPAEGAPVRKNGGNDAKHDHIRTDAGKGSKHPVRTANSKMGKGYGS